MIKLTDIDVILPVSTPMPIDASLFAHIHNDAFLTGTVKLQGNFFKNTITYLTDYCDLLTRPGQEIPDAYLQLIRNLSYLQDIELDMRACQVDTDILLLAEKITDDVLNITIDKNILIPGGWSNAKSGHAMVYQFSRKSVGYVFTVFNSGAGLRYHAKKSSQDKELYNPRKMWSIPVPKTTKEKKELALFIGRLLHAKIKTKSPNLNVEANEEMLYELILPSISYIQGKEISADEGMPEYAYTGGQLSGTCAQRAIHQMLKINADSQKTYQHFIFNFKIHSLREYIDACVNGAQPFNHAVVDQINLAIDNSLKILSIPELFTADDVAKHKQSLMDLKKRVAQAQCADMPSIRETIDFISQPAIVDSSLQFYPIEHEAVTFFSQKPSIMEDYHAFAVLKRLQLTISAIKKENNFAIKCIYIEQLVFSLPLTEDGKFTAEVYHSLKNSVDYQVFLTEMNRLQEVITNLRSNWLQRSQIPLFNHLSLSVLSLQIDAYEMITSISREKQGIGGLPSFARFGAMIMGFFIAERDRDPFEATNHVYADMRICSLKKRFPMLSSCSDRHALDYYLAIMKTEYTLNVELTELYQQKYGEDISEEHRIIRKKNAGSLFMICLHLDKTSPNRYTLGAKYNPLIDKIQTQFAQELEFCKAINPYFIYDRGLNKPLSLRAGEIISPVMPSYFLNANLEGVTKDKYNLADSSAGNALETDSMKRGIWQELHTGFETANAIQLLVDEPTVSKKRHHITTADIIARNYFHLRSDPSLQITLTLDYFTLHVSQLHDPNSQRYVEANLFQPGLLTDALLKDAFIPQFDHYLKTGKRYFAQQGQHTVDSLQFFRLDLLVSRYYAQLNSQEGTRRLKMMYEDLVTQLLLSSDIKVVYVFQQYLFLAAVARIEAGEHSTMLLDQAMQSHFYIKRHANPLILEDASYRVEIERAIAKFKLFASQQAEIYVQESVKKALLALEMPVVAYRFMGTFPNYALVADNGSELKVDALQAIVSEKGLIKTGVPIAIQSHPLMKQLGLQAINTCLANFQGTYFVIQGKEGTIHIYYKENKLTIHKDWTIRGKTARYELQALTEKHEAKYANHTLKPVYTKLPAVLSDATMNYWKNTSFDDSEKGLFVRNNVPAYIVFSTHQIKPVTEEPLKQACQLVVLALKESQILHAFESHRFIVAYGDKKNTFVQLPRYGLHIQINHMTHTMINEATGECVLDAMHPIHYSVAGLILEGKGQRRVLVPKMRFYGLEEGVVSDFYPVAHDKDNRIAEHILSEHWKRGLPAKEPLWDYQGSEQCVSFQIIQGVPIADTPADALYLAYTYLVTNQAEKAWKILENCIKRLGGLTGDPDELNYIHWMCNHLPYLMTNKDDSRRGTPSVVACKLQAMSLLSDYLLQGGRYNLRPPAVSKNDANAVYAQCQYQELVGFLQALPQTIYNYFTQYQTMGRYLECQYQLSKIDRKRLLDYYYQSLPAPSKALGALGYQWTLLSFEALKEEEKFFIVQQQIGALSPAEKKRLAHIQKQLKERQAVQSLSTDVELVALDLHLPLGFKIKNSTLKTLLKTFSGRDVEQEFFKRKGTIHVEECRQAIECLLSDISDDDFIERFPAYLQIAVSFEDDELRKALLNFCTQMLIAARHLACDAQHSNIPYLCNVLYRVAHYHQVELGSLDYFTELVRKVRDADVPPIKVYQAKDNYKKVLATPEQMIAQYKEQVHQPICTTRLANQSLVLQMGIGAQLTVQEQLNFDGFRVSYQKIQEDLAKALDMLGQNPSQGAEEEYVIEEQAGKAIFLAEGEKKALVQRLLKEHPSLVQGLQASAHKASAALQAETIKRWDDALTFAQQGPDDEKLAQIWAIENESRARSRLTKADLFSLYTKADWAYSLAKTGLSREKIQKLHDAIHQALVRGICYQSADNVSRRLQEALNESNLSSAVAALDLLARADIPALDKPAIVLLQHEEQILLHHRQVSALKKLLAPLPDGRGFKEVVEKVIMGGGKSKVILPIQAEMKAQGGNLVIVEVPQALLATNHDDLNRTSQRLYGKRAYRFDFNRDSDVSPKRLQQIYAMFVEIMTHKNYLVTTGETMQSLELKYIELLLEEKDSVDKVVEQQIFWLDQITALVHHHGDCIIDEVHQGLSIKKRLNYTGSGVQPVGFDAIRNVIALYKLIDPQFIAKAPQLSPDYDWTPFKKELADKLLSDKKSPLYSFAQFARQKHGAGIQQELIAYLMNKAQESCVAVINASSAEKDMLAFFKQEVGVLLPQTLVRSLNEHYGASKRKDLSAIEKTLALPYAANNVVNERSRFGNQLEALNYTAQMMLIRGISQKLLMQKLGQWQVLARKELFQDATFKHLDDTPTGKGFRILAGKLGLKLSEVDVKNVDQLKTLHAHFQHHPTLLFEVLQEQALGQVQQEGETLFSNSFNHVALYRSVQAVSGTLSNHSTFHHRLHYNKASSLGTDGYIIEVIHNKNTPIKAYDCNNIYQFIERILLDPATPIQVSERTRAIIDICATFQGVSNVAVAREIACFYRTTSNQTIRHVLYFDKNQILCAIDIHKPTRPIVLKTTDEKEISRLLGSMPSQRFTYYDQSHTVGTDLSQAKNAHAVVLVDDKTSLQAFLQGSMRMRGLALEQTMDIIVPEQLSGITRKELIQQFAKNDNLMLLNDNLTSAKLQMSNLIRHQCLLIIRVLPGESVAKKRQLAQVFKPFFVDKPSESFYELYGALNKKQAAADILKRHKEQLIARWTICMAPASLILFLVKDDETMDKYLNAIIDKSLPNCLNEYDAADRGDFALEVQIQAEIEAEVELEVAILGEFFDPNLAERGVITLQNTDKYAMDNYALSLNSICSSTVPTDVFSQQLAASKNYAAVYKKQIKYIDCFLKPAWVTWYYVQEGKLRAMIVTPQEIPALIKTIEIDPLKDSWFATNLDTVVAGKRPEGILKNEQYLALREQVRFFNGDISILLDQHTFYWLGDRATEKLEFFKRYLMPYRPDSAVDLPQLKTCLLQTSKEGYIYIAKHRFEDLSGVDWKKIHTKVLPAQIVEYSRVAEAFAYINRYWDKKALGIAQLAQMFDLSLIGLSYVQEHLDLITSVNRIIHHVAKSNGKNSFLSELAADEKKFLEQYFDMSLKEFSEQYKLAIDLHALMFLCLHPALKGTLKEKQLTDLILQNPDCNSEVILTLLDSSFKLSAAAWQAILKKPWSADETECIAKNILSQEKTVFPEFVLDYVWDQFKGSDERLIKLAELATNNQFFNRIFSERKINYLVHAALLKNALFSPEQLLYYFVEHHGHDVDGLMLIFNYFEFATPVFRQCIDLSGVKLSRTTQFNLLTLLGNRIIGDLAFAEIVCECTEREIDQLLALNVDYTEAHMRGLINKVNTKTQITPLLNRSEMTSSMADVVFKNPHYENKIGDWKWLTETQLLDTLNKTTDFDSLQRALNHENLSKSARIKWLKTVEKQHEKQDKKALRDPQQKVWHQLESLRILACKHAIAGMKTAEYVDVARTAFDLYQILHRATTTYLSPNNLSLNHYKAMCEGAIERATRVLGTHRGYKQKILDILNVILAYVTFNPPKEGKKWRFFEVNTGSMQRVRDTATAIRALPTIQ